jgi:hypothetical protein
MRVRSRSSFVLERTIVGARQRGLTGAVHWASGHCLMLALTNVSDPDLDNRRARPLIPSESDGVDGYWHS